MGAQTAHTEAPDRGPGTEGSGGGPGANPRAAVDPETWGRRGGNRRSRGGAPNLVATLGTTRTRTGQGGTEAAGGGPGGPRAQSGHRRPGGPTAQSGEGRTRRTQSPERRGEDPEDPQPRAAATERPLVRHFGAQAARIPRLGIPARGERQRAVGAGARATWKPGEPRDHSSFLGH